jgi:hypothetical protein
MIRKIRQLFATLLTAAIRVDEGVEVDESMRKKTNSRDLAGNELRGRRDRRAAGSGGLAAPFATGIEAALRALTGGFYKTNKKKADFQMKRLTLIQLAGAFCIRFKLVFRASALSQKVPYEQFSVNFKDDILSERPETQIHYRSHRCTRSVCAVGGRRPICCRRGKQDLSMIADKAFAANSIWTQQSRFVHTAFSKKNQNYL